MYRPTIQKQAQTKTSKGGQINLNQTERNESITKSRKSIIKMAKQGGKNNWSNVIYFTMLFQLQKLLSVKWDADVINFTFHLTI